MWFYRGKYENFSSYTTNVHIPSFEYMFMSLLTLYSMYFSFLEKFRFQRKYEEKGQHATKEPIQIQTQDIAMPPTITANFNKDHENIEHFILS